MDLHQLDPDPWSAKPLIRNRIRAEIEKIQKKLFNHENFYAPKNDSLCFVWAYYLCALNKSVFSISKIWYSGDFYRFLSEFPLILTDFATRIQIKTWEDKRIEGKARGKSRGAALPARGKPRPSRPFNLDLLSISNTVFQSTEVSRRVNFFNAILVHFW